MPKAPGRAPAPCPFCDLACGPPFLFCPGCGGALAPADLTDDFLRLLARCRVLLRHRVWYGLGEALKLAGERLTARPDLRGQAEPALRWLGEETRQFALGAGGADFPRVVTVAGGVLPLLPDGA